MIKTHDLETFSKLGNALWLDPEFSERFTSETLAAVSLLHLTEERTIEKASAALLTRAKTMKMVAHNPTQASCLNRPFFRLSLEQRFILVALHLGHWSYDRLSRILEKSVDEIQEIAWRARLQLLLPIGYPSGPSSLGVRCPDYDLKRPWTQRFLDDEIASPRDRLFLQNHLLACHSCRGALARCRDLYFKIDQEISPLVGSSSSSDSLNYLKEILTQGVFQKYPSERTFKDSLSLFMQRKYVRVLLWGLLALCIMSKFHFP